jgi:hypothetical protein
MGVCANPGIVAKANSKAVVAISEYFIGNSLFQPKTWNRLYARLAADLAGFDLTGLDAIGAKMVTPIND